MINDLECSMIFSESWKGMGEIIQAKRWLESLTRSAKLKTRQLAAFTIAAMLMNMPHPLAIKFLRSHARIGSPNMRLARVALEFFGK